MKSMILYSSRIAGDRGETVAVVSKGEVVFVRGQTVNFDIEKALRAARPRKGETVLNTIPID